MVRGWNDHKKKEREKTKGKFKCEEKWEKRKKKRLDKTLKTTHMSLIFEATDTCMFIEDDEK